ncbi:MAG: OmpA family protein [Pseudanabaenaceae cyanobacterium bins.39]|nr:OmpA family protein [Pseudanabaenaceae cyanobacterium bins.39]
MNRSQRHPLHRQRLQALSLCSTLMFLGLGDRLSPVVAQTIPFYNISVNSHQDNNQRDRQITLREAILIANGTLPINQLTDAERAQITPSQKLHQINFIQIDDPKIQLQSALPELIAPMAIDGTTHPQYQSDRGFSVEIPIPQPIVTITPAPNVEIMRGISITNDNVIIKGLSIYGFNSRHYETAVTPLGDIFIAHRLPPPITTEQQPPAQFAPFHDRDRPASRILIEDNWLGIPPDGSMPAQPSAFGIYLFHGIQTNISRNRIANHEGSGIITAVDSRDSVIQQNVIEGNGFDGMPDGIRLEGNIDRMQVRSNIICGNAGSAVFLFKPEGAIRVQDNSIKFNSRFYRRSAIHLMGRGNIVSDNRIFNQAGSGVTVEGFPGSDRNIIRQNQFQQIEGLDIDLIHRRNVGERDFRVGDGRNPQRDSYFRRVDTGNAAINTPEFLADVFNRIDDKVGIDGIADPNTEIDIYRLRGTAMYELITTIKTNDQGRFSTRLTNLKAGDSLSAIATDPEFGTSEPARPVRISDLNRPIPPSPPPPPLQPQCTTPPPPPVAIEPPPPAPPTLQLPRQVHFALDRDFISPASAKVIDRLVTVLKTYPSITLELVGHTDPRATDAYNLELGLRRSRSVSQYLRRQGISPERIVIRSQGERQRLTNQTDVVNYARDRRVEFFLLNIQGIEIHLIDQQEDIQVESK